VVEQVEALQEQGARAADAAACAAQLPMMPAPTTITS